MHTAPSPHQLNWQGYPWQNEIGYAPGDGHRSIWSRCACPVLQARPSTRALYHSVCMLVWNSSVFQQEIIIFQGQFTISLHCSGTILHFLSIISASSQGSYLSACMLVWKSPPIGDIWAEFTWFWVNWLYFGLNLVDASMLVWDSPFWGLCGL